MRFGLEDVVGGGEGLGLRDEEDVGGEEEEALSKLKKVSMAVEGVEGVGR